MKISNPRSGWTVEGKHLATLKAGQRPTPDEMLSYYNLRGTDKNYESMAAPMRFDRVVILRDSGNLVVVPLNPDIYMVN